MNFSPRIFAFLLVLSMSAWQALAGGVTGPANQRRPMDVLFMIDGSGSVTPRGFDKLRLLLKQIIDDMNVDYFSGQGCHVALIQFSSRKLTKVEFNLDTFNNKNDMKRAIENMVYQRKYTYTGYAMKLAEEKVFNGKDGDRVNAKNVILLFTDGHAADPHIARAVTKKMKSQGDHVMTVGFGPKKYVNRFKKELETMSSNSEKDVFLNGFEDAENIANRLVETSLPKSDCSIAPCLNGGRCQNQGDSFFCHCPEEYYGITCELKRGPCYKNPCQNDGVCVENGIEFKCVCTDEFQGQLCEKEKVVCRTRNTDILFIIDDSRSVRRSEYQLMKDFVIRMTNRFNISEDESHVALIQFSARTTTVIKFHLNRYYDKASLKTRISELQLSDGTATHTDFALRMAREQIFNGRQGDRSDVRNVIILMTDGESNDNAAAIREAELLRDDDVSIIAIGVGKGDAQDSEAENGGAFYKFLEDLSSGTEYTFGASFAKLDTIIDGVIKAACENLQDT